MEYPDPTVGKLAVNHVSPSGKLQSTLIAAKRSSRLVGYANDPIAQDVIVSGNVSQLEQELKKVGVTGTFSYVGGGASSVILESDGKIVRIGRWEAKPRLNIPEMLQSEHYGNVGSIGFEVLPKADTSEVTEADVSAMSEILAQKGYVFSDPGTDNLGRMGGKVVVLDPGAVEQKLTFV